MKRPGPTPLKAVVLSVLWPGLGHFGHRNRRGAMLVALSLVGVAAAVIWVARHDPGEIVAWGANMTAMRIVVAVSLFTLAVRWLVAVDAWRLARRRHERPKSRRARTVVTLLFLGLAVWVTAPHVIAVRFAVAHMGMLSDVFKDDAPRVAVPTLTPTTAVPAAIPEASRVLPAATPEASRALPTSSTTLPTVPHAPVAPSRTTGAASTVPPPPATALVTTTTTRVPAVLPLEPPETTSAGVTGGSPFTGVERLTVALLGSDAIRGRYGVRTDTIVVVSVDVTTGDAAAFSVPRNWYRVPFPDGTPAAERWPAGYPGLANEIYALGLSHPQLFPGVDPPGSAIKSALAQLTGLTIQYYVMVDMAGFVELVDLFGGIEVNVTETIRDRITPVVRGGPHITIDVTPGVHHFDGSTALGYVRSRRQSSDWRRMTRQRCVIGAFIDQVSPLEILYRYETLAGIITDHMATDIPLQHLTHLVALAGRLDASRLTTVAFVPPEFPSGSAPVTLVRRTVSETLDSELSQPDGTAFSDACGPAS